MGRRACELERVELSSDQLEALRLSDLEGLYQEAAAARMGVSRATFGRILTRARATVAEALVHSKVLVVGDGPVVEGVPGSEPCPVHGEDKRRGRGCRCVDAADRGDESQPARDLRRAGDRRMARAGEEMVMLRIAVPVADGRFCSHFGGAQTFAVFTVDPATRVVTERVDGAPPAHERGVFPAWLRALGVTTVLAGGMGGRAQAMFGAYDIEVVTGAEGDDPGALVDDFLAGRLVSTGAACGGGLHDCGHHHD